MDTENFAELILDWYEAGHRDLPWRNTRDPYRIWISEIMLQQTRAETVVSYYERFLSHYPDVFTLANAGEGELLKCWEGLGYYSRARMLQKAAKVIAAEYGGALPADVKKLRALPGIGDYTAGAIASIAFGIPAAAVDGNVERVICRVDAVTAETGSPAVRKRITERAQQLVPKDRPGAFANAMMELGATVCTPRNPACLVCPVRSLCEGFARGIAQKLPHKPKKKAQRVENRAVLIIVADDRVLVTRRQERLLSGLFVFPDVLDETEPAKICEAAGALGVSCAYDSYAGHARHVFTHIIWEMDVHILQAESAADVENGQWVTQEELAALAMPTAVRFAREAAMLCLSAQS